VILAKTVTAELGGSHPGPTTNPFDPRRTPGGSSSGSAAAVGANMVPAAIGTQVGGSIIRPAAYCGNFALKPTQGGINRGERLATSHEHARPARRLPRGHVAGRDRDGQALRRRPRRARPDGPRQPSRPR
jgi:Asp-tRNA(Asn)/Glu-tRNA(Gln) amidotransferase A subunit family amidase